MGSASNTAHSTLGTLVDVDLRFETSAVSDASPEARQRRRRALPLSLAAHGAVLAVVLIAPLLMTEALPEPGFSVRAFLVEPPSAPAPPPPPPAPSAAVASARRAARPVVAEPTAFTAPMEVPVEVRRDDSLDLGIQGGDAGGVEGGVPGGVVGGVVGGLPEKAPAPQQPVRVGGLIGEPRKLRHVAPAYPDLAVKARMQGVVIIEAVVNERGEVIEAKVLRGVPLLDQAAIEAVRQWAYTPTLLNGIPIPVVMTVTVTFQLDMAAPPHSG